jgi:two-component system, oxyanion-binding sensor
VSRRELAIGVTPLTDVAPLAAAFERGEFAREGLRVRLSPEPSWANVRDKLAAGALDAAQALAPMALAATLGAGPVHAPTLTGLALGLGGNAVTVSARLRDALLEQDPHALASAAASGRALARLAARTDARIRLAVVFPHSMHAYLVRLWLAGAGLRPDRDVRLSVVPPARMVAELESGAIDGFCVGEPWNTLCALRGSGTVLFAAHELWPRAPEKVLAVNARWHDRNEEVHRALLRAVLRAARWCDAPENRRELARLLAERGWVAAPEAALARSLAGEVAAIPDFHVFHRAEANRPRRSHAMWIATQMLRWGDLEKPLDLRAAASDVYRADLYRAAARDLGLDASGADEEVELIGGARFDPARAAEYATGFEIAELRVRPDELAAAQVTRA